MTEFTMSMYKNKEDLYKAKAEHCEAMMKHYKQKAAFWKELFEKLCKEITTPEASLSEDKVTWVISEEIIEGCDYLAPKKWYREGYSCWTASVDEGDNPSSDKSQP